MARIKIDLVGGPALPNSGDGFREVEQLREKVKVAVRDGYEHFVHNGEFQRRGNDNVAIFRWVGRTKIAE